MKTNSRIYAFGIETTLAADKGKAKKKVRQTAKGGPSDGFKRHNKKCENVARLTLQQIQFVFRIKVDFK